MKKNQLCDTVLWQYFFITYLVILVNDFSYLHSVNYIGTITPYFIMTVYLTYSLIYLLPVFLLLFLLNRTLSFLVFTRLAKYISVLHSWFIYSLAVLVFTLVQILIYADKMIFQIYGFHLNGFVWNLVFTPGGLESLGGGRSSIVSFASIMVGFLTLQILLLVLILSFKRIQTIWRSVVTRPVIITSVVLYFIMFFFQGITLGLSSLRGYTPVLAASKTFPLYHFLFMISSQFHA